MRLIPAFLDVIVKGMVSPISLSVYLLRVYENANFWVLTFYLAVTELAI